MESTEALFEDIRTKMINAHDGVNAGTMMGSPGIQYKGKNFAFIYRGNMCFRLGRDFDPESEGIQKYDLLNPFKNKPPLKDWFVISRDYQEKWQELSEIALGNMLR